MAVTLTASASGVGGTLSVSGTGYIPSSGGQQVLLWIGYPDDFCAPQPADPADQWVCHGFYNNPVVADDGTFAVEYADALPQAGTGEVAATQWNAKKKRWVEVARVSYSV